MLYANSSREYVILYTVAHITEKRYYMAPRMCSCQWAMRAIFFFSFVFFSSFLSTTNTRISHILFIFMANNNNNIFAHK